MSISLAGDPERAARVAWRRAFDEQLTRATMDRVRAYAETRAKVIGRLGSFDEASGARELMHEAIAVTLAGTYRWEPAKKLEYHLIDTIRTQTKNALKRLRRNRLAWLDDSRDDTSSDGCRLENEATLKHATKPAAPPIDLHAAAQRLLAHVREQIITDPDVSRLVDAMANGATDHGDLMKASGLRPAKFRNARRRLARITARLPHETRAAAQAAL